MLFLFENEGDVAQPTTGATAVKVSLMGYRSLMEPAWNLHPSGVINQQRSPREIH
jgi:hypothetical protein